MTKVIGAFHGYANDTKYRSVIIVQAWKAKITDSKMTKIIIIIIIHELY